MMIKLNDLLKLDNLSNIKVRFNLSSSSYNAIGNYYTDKEKLLIGNFYNSEHKRWFNENDIVIGLAQISGDRWLLFDISRITKDHNRLGFSDAGLYDFYDHVPVREYEGLFERVVVKYHKSTMAPVMRGDTALDNLEVFEILPITLDNMTNFPGYDKVSVSFAELKNNLTKSREWQTALKCRKGVYVISDEAIGKLYVGSAYGENGIYGRWETYVESGFDKNEVENGKYPNKRFQKIVKEHGIEYIHNNFHYALLETFTDNVPDEQIIQRESFWKEVLLTRDFGYNEN